MVWSPVDFNEAQTLPEIVTKYLGPKTTRPVSADLADVVAGWDEDWEDTEATLDNQARYVSSTVYITSSISNLGHEFSLLGQNWPGVKRLMPEK